MARGKKKIWALLLIMALVSTLVPNIGIRTVEAAGKTMANATKITFGTKTSGYINENSKDWYKFVLPTSGRLTVKLHTEISQVDMTLYNEDASDWLFSENVHWNSTTKVGNKSFTIDLTAGTYYFLIEYMWGCGKYDVTATFNSASESFLNGYDANGKQHSDDTMKTANSISFGKNYTGQLADNDKLDFYKFTLGRAAKVTLSAKAWMSVICYEFYDSNGVFLERDYAHWNSTTGVSNYSVTYSFGKGTYYLVVSRYSYYDTGKYNIKITNNIPKGWKTVSGKTYYYNANGDKVKGWQTIGGKKYYFNSDGSAKTGWLKYKDKWYFFDVKTLTMVVGQRKLGGIMCTFNSDGTLKTSLPKELGSYLKVDQGIFIRHIPNMKDIGCTTAKVYSTPNLMVSDKAFNNKIQSITIRNTSSRTLKGVGIGMTKAQVQSKLKGKYKSVKNGTEYKMNDGTTLKITYKNGKTSKVVLVV